MSFRSFRNGFFFIAAFLAGGVAGRAQTGRTAQTAADLIKSGDTFDRKLQEAEALKYYLPAEKLEPGNAELLVSISRQYRHLAIDATLYEEKARLSEVALNYARRAAELAPADSDAQLEVAVCYGKLVPFQGQKAQLESSAQIKTFADEALKLNPRNDLAWHVLGRWHQVLAEVGGMKRTLGSILYGKIPVTTNEAAVKCFEKAIELNPTRMRHYVELGCTYAHMGRVAQARTALEKGLAMPNAEKDDPLIKMRGREELAKLPAG